MLARQLYLKLTKFTRRANETKDLLGKILKGYDFLKFMAVHNLYAIRRSRKCLKRLSTENVQEVSLYGAGDIAEVLYDLTFEAPVRIKAIYADSVKEKFLGFKITPIEEVVRGREKLIVASLVAVDDKIERLRKLGVERQRIVLLS